MAVAGIEAINVFGGTAYLDVMRLAEYRNLDPARFENLLMKEKAVALPYEDPVTFGVNAAKPIIDRLTEAEKDRIESLITCSESGIDFGKSLSTYIHDHLGLNRNCRLFELKQACYSGTAGLQMALNFILSQTSPRSEGACRRDGYFPVFNCRRRRCVKRGLVLRRTERRSGCRRLIDR